MNEQRPAVQADPALRVLFSAEQIAARVREMGLELARDYDGTRPLFVAVLTRRPDGFARLDRTHGRPWQ